MLENTLITIHDNDILIRAIDARELHKTLELKKDYSNWIKTQINRAYLQENVDYIKVHSKGEDINQQLTKVGNRIEYFITLDAGKNIAMLSGTPAGRLVREYFIMCEKKLKENHPQTYLEAIKALVKKEEERLELENKINTSTLFPDKIKVDDKERAYKKDIKELYPFLNNSIANIMEFFGKYKYKDTNSYIKEEVELCVNEFFDTCSMAVSNNKLSVVITHECLLGGKLCVRKDHAIKYLRYKEEDFIIDTK